MEEINAILIRKGNNILLSGYIHKDNEILNKFAKNISPISEEEKTIIEYDTIEEIDTSIIEPDLDPRDLEFFPRGDDTRDHRRKGYESPRGCNRGKFGRSLRISH